jgi:hypothetical protein
VKERFCKEEVAVVLVAVNVPTVSCPTEEEARNESMNLTLVAKRAEEVAFRKEIPPFEAMEKALVVAPAVGSANTEKSGRLESEEVAEMVRREAGEVVPIPKKEAMVEATVVEVAVKLVKENAPPLVKLKPEASTLEVQGV